MSQKEIDSSFQDRVENGKPGFSPFWGLRLLSFFMSAALFWSGFLTVLSPLPLLLLAFSSPLLWTLLAVLVNSAMVIFMAGEVSFLFYLVFAVAPTLAIPLAVRRGFSLNSVIFSAVGSMVLSAALIWLVHSLIQNISPVLGIEVEIGRLVDYMIKVVPPENLKAWFHELTPDEIKRKFLVEFPSGVLILAMLVVWANILLLLQVNPKGMRTQMGLNELFFKNWKAPEWVLWPTLSFAAAMILGRGWIEDVGQNGFKVLMSIYAVQGLAVLSAVFEAWGLKGLFRSLAYMISLFLMLPLVLSLGFFDLWFDFRAKLRQT